MDRAIMFTEIKINIQHYLHYLKSRVFNIKTHCLIFPNIMNPLTITIINNKHRAINNNSDLITKKKISNEGIIKINIITIKINMITIKMNTIITIIINIIATIKINNTRGKDSNKLNRYMIQKIVINLKSLKNMIKINILI